MPKFEHVLVAVNAVVPLSIDMFEGWEGELFWLIYSRYQSVFPQEMPKFEHVLEAVTLLFLSLLTCYLGY
jgi:hypothetical protein